MSKDKDWYEKHHCDVVPNHIPRCFMCGAQDWRCETTFHTNQFSKNPDHGTVLVENVEVKCCNCGIDPAANTWVYKQLVHLFETRQKQERFKEASPNAI
jgi:hypothetical protein